MMNSTPLVSAIIPVHNGAATLAACLEGLAASDYPALEVIVADDSSSDDSAAIAQQAGVQVVSVAPQRGAAAGRNVGAQHAQGEVLVFVDADVVVHADAIWRMVGYLQQESDAVFGLYAATTPAPGIYSRFKNLQHHYVHRSNTGRATTFWTGCGAVRRAAFDAVGGFDSTIDYMEDINLGHRLTQAGFCVLLADDILCTHLKHYTLVSLVRSDLFGRAVPWTRLLLSQRGSFGTLNTSQRDRAGVLATGVLLLALLASLRWRRLLALVVALMVFNGWLNRDFLRYAATIYHVPFSGAALLLLHLYYINCGLGLAIGTAQHVAEQWIPEAKM